MSRITGILKDGMGKPIVNCKIMLKALRTSTTVIAHTVASQNPNEAGLYDMTVEPGQYRVMFCVDGYPPEYVGDIQVYKDSPNGTLNYFLGLPQDNDLRPDAIKHFEAMVDKVASQVAEVEKSKLAAEGSARSAAASADRASQITGLSTVADAISMASVPLPDVWIPFNDSLQMITGYGEEVKVGAVTVAKMVSFNRDTTATYIDKSGTLRNADINEPRFEADGVLNEGASTNLLPYSNDFTRWNLGSSGTGSMPIITGSYTSSPDGTKNATRLQLNKGSGVTENDQASMTLPITTTKDQIYSLSMWMKSNTPGVTYKVSLSFNGANVTVLSVTDKWQRFSIKGDPAIDNARYPRIQLRGTVGTSDSVDLCVFGIQMENFPFSTSYIPTNGTQVTRAYELPTIPYGKNAHEDMSVAIEITARSYVPPYSNWIVDFASNSNNERYAICYDNSGQVFAYGFGLAAAVVDGFSLNQRSVVVAVWRASDKQVSIYLNGKRGQAANGTQSPVIASHGLIRLMRTYAGVASNGNVRNLRIWHKALTEEQARAIR